MYLVKKIIDRCERSSSDWRTGATGGRTMKIEQADYDKAGKTALVEEIFWLSGKGLLTSVKWIIRGSDAERIAYRIEDLQDFYRLWQMEDAQFCPKQRRICMYQERLRQELEQPFQKKWMDDYLECLLEKLKGGVLPKDLEKLSVYLSSLRGIDQLTEPVFKRIFSKRWLGNSKTFEREAEKHIITIARTWCKEIDEGMDDKTVLSQLYIEEYAQELAVKGPLKILLSDFQIDLSAFLYGTVLNSETLKYGEICMEQAKIRRVVTIENKANFISVSYDPSTLYIFSHGYFSPREKEFLIRLRNVLDKNGCVEYFHSGDMDYGGICIFEYIRKRIFPDVKPLDMDAAVFEKYRKYTEKIEDSTKEKLAKMEVSQDMRDLAAKILESGRVLEQEILLVQWEG